MKLLRIKDNSRSQKSFFSPIENLTAKIADKTLEQLEREGVFVFPGNLQRMEDLTGEQMILQGVNDSYQTGNVMGFLGWGDERLIIESRFCGEEGDFLFQYLLEQVVGIPNLVNLKSDTSQENRLFHVLLFLFPHSLKAAMRKGIFKQYTSQAYNDEKIKGVVDVPRHLKQNTPFYGKVAYNQREFSYDNNLMELVRHTLEFIKGRPYGNHLLSRVRGEVQLVRGATPGYNPCQRQKIVKENRENPVQHAYFREYGALQRLCLLILQHQKHQIGSGSRQIYGILFDGAWLWEEYIASLLQDLFYHPKNKSGKGGQRLFAGGVGLIYPDFLSKDSENRFIADAKYKPMDHIGNRDYLQVLAYMVRFEATSGYYLYPEVEETQDVRLWLNRGSTFEKNVTAREDLCVVKHGLKIPSTAHSYKEFVAELKESENKFKQEFISGGLGMSR